MQGKRLSFWRWAATWVLISIALVLCTVLIPYGSYAEESDAAVQEATVETEETDEEAATEETDEEETAEEAVESESADEEDASAEAASEESEEAEEAAEDVSAAASVSTLSTASVTYQAYVSGTGWQSSVSDGSTAGTTGQSLALRGLKVSVSSDVSGGVSISGHYASIGWQSASSGTTAQTLNTSYDLQAVKIELTGDLADEYDVYYRVHSAYFGWLGWACNGEAAGTTGWGYAAQAIQIVIVEKGADAPGSTDDACITSPWSVTFTQVDETTEVDVSVDNAAYVLKRSKATSVRITATMSYNGVVTREITETVALSDLDDGTFTMDFTTYGAFQVKVEFIKSGSTVKSSTREVAVTASEYNLAPLSATFPVVLFSLAYWDLNTAEDGSSIPTIIMLGRPSAYDWDALPEGMYAMPYISEDDISSTCSYVTYAAYVADLYRVSPDSTFNLYINDMTCTMVHQMIYANGIPEGQYTITLLSDGSGTYLKTNEAYAGDDPYATNEELVAAWEEAKAYAYETGEVADGYGYHGHMDSMYVVLQVEEDSEWWMARTNLFTSGDDNVFADEMITDSRIIKKSVSTMLTDLEAKGDDVVAAFKALYNFNDSYFSEAEEQGKEVMIILGTYTQYEYHFEDYVNLVKTYYGDDYLYYYKGHPNTPTGLDEDKQELLDELELIDIDSSVAAELILFFNPDVSLSGYGSSTFNSATDEMSGGLFGMSKSEALDESSSVDYTVMDWFAEPVDEDTDEAIQALCEDDDSCYLMEFSDEILADADYDIAIYSADANTITYYKLTDEGEYEVVRVQRGSLGVRVTAHSQSYGWLDSVGSGVTAGVTGESKRLEAIQITLTDTGYEGSITYRVHVSGTGWQDWVSDGETAGTTGQSRSIQAIQIELTGELAEYYDVYYRVHSQTYGWLDWACNGEVAGTVGLSKRAEAVQVVLVAKGGDAPGSTDTPSVENTVKSTAHVQTYGWTSGTFSTSSNSLVLGTTGQSKRIEALTLKLSQAAYSGGITYRTHVQTYGWQDWVSDGATSGTTGLSKRIEAIQIALTGDMADEYDIYYRVHVQTYGWLGWAKNGETAGTTGLSKRIEAIEIVLVKKGGEAPGSTDGAYVSAS